MFCRAIHKLLNFFVFEQVKTTIDSDAVELQHSLRLYSLPPVHKKKKDEGRRVAHLSANAVERLVGREGTPRLLKGAPLQVGAIGLSFFSLALFVSPWKNIDWIG